MKTKLIFIIAVFLTVGLNAQTVVNLDATTNGTTQTGCAYWFYDDGGAGGSYTTNYDYTITFSSTGAPNTHIRLSFASFDIDPSDTLFIYDGSTTAAPLLGAYNNNNPLTIPNTIVQATITNVSGDLTIRFKSSAAGTSTGWNASVSCIPQCQNVLAAVDTMEMIPLPDDSNYVDICFGDIITFAACGYGPGVFPQNDLLYHQDSTTTLFIWDFGDGVIDTGRVIDHQYTIPTGYDVYLTVIDSIGCQNTQLLNLRVRMSSNPIVDIKPLPDICIGDTIDILAGENATSTIVVAPVSSQQVATEVYDSTTFIPDGPSCLPNCYGTPVTFSTFPLGSSIVSASDIASICINMEHTFAGDLSFRIVCPNNQSVVLDSYDNSGGSDLGIANSNDGSPTCSASANPPGTGWTYCWSEIYPQQGTLNVLDAGTSPIPQTDTINNTNYITPENPLSGLVGCPLNGTWSIEICDEWGIDNGYVFWWALTLLNQQQTGSWTYSVDLDSVTWAGPYIYGTSDSTAIIVPDTAGSFVYTATVWDEYGCSYDTTFTVEVLDNPLPDLGADTVLCEGNTIQLDGGSIGTTYAWSTGATNQTIDIDISGLYFVTVTNSNGNVSCYGYDSIQVNFVPWASVDLGPDLCIPSGPTTLDAQNPGYNYTWSTGDTTQTIDISSSGTYAVSVSYGNYNMCGDDDEINVSVIPTATVDLGLDFELCRHQYAVLDATQTPSSLYSYLWSTGSSLSYVALEGMAIGDYTFTVQVIGCDTATDAITVSVIPCDLTVPNIITPNGDGKNDEFRVTNLEYYPNSILQVFNRWGKMVYENNNYLNDWDGEDYADGTYFFILKVNYGNEEYEDMHGTITILRK